MRVQRGQKCLDCPQLCQLLQLKDRGGYRINITLIQNQ
ncbi:unnamed protein product [Paramecium sonneborni]|uniref:Uncharacterized protein n=1 Tax=Paramecium sonneborni TaxID=65129 RepID=A0A8S1RE75_9CILI|nr:unnamed protein product [Paramecium sonneborni]